MTPAEEIAKAVRGIREGASMRMGAPASQKIAADVTAFLKGANGSPRALALARVINDNLEFKNG